MGRRGGLVRGVIGTECGGAGFRAEEGRKGGVGGKTMVVEVDSEVRVGGKGNGGSDPAAATAA